MLGEKMNKRTRALIRPRGGLLPVLLTLAACGEPAVEAELLASSQAAMSVADLPSLRLPEAVNAEIRGVVDAEFLPLRADAGPSLDRFGGVPSRPIGQHIFGTRPTSDDDLLGSWQAGWNRQGLVLRVHVRDEQQSSDSSHAWEDDAIEVFLDGDDSKGATYDGQNDYHLVIRPTKAPVVELGLSSATDLSGIRVKGSSLAASREIELLVPWALLGGVAEKGRRIGIDVQVDDDDDGGGRDHKLATFASTDEAWTNPSVFGTLTLGAAFQTPGGHRAELTVLDRQTKQPIPNATVYLSAQRGVSGNGSPTDGQGRVQFGGCDPERVFQVDYYVGGLYATVIAAGAPEPSYYSLQGNPLVGYCALLEETLYFPAR